MTEPEKEKARSLYGRFSYSVRQMYRPGPIFSIRIPNTRTVEQAQ